MAINTPDDAEVKSVSTNITVTVVAARGVILLSHYLVRLRSTFSSSNHYRTEKKKCYLYSHNSECVTCTHRSPWRPGEGIGSLGAGVIGVCEPPDVGADIWIQALWIGHEVLLTNEPYFQALFLLPYCLKSFNIQVMPLISWPSRHHQQYYIESLQIFPVRRFI